MVARLEDQLAASPYVDPDEPSSSQKSKKKKGLSLSLITFETDLNRFQRQWQASEQSSQQTEFVLIRAATLSESIGHTNQEIKEDESKLEYVLASNLGLLSNVVSERPYGDWVRVILPRCISRAQRIHCILSCE